MSLKASLPHLSKSPKLCRSEILGCDISLDTGASGNVIPSDLLSKLRERGFVIEPVDTNVTLNFADGSSRHHDLGWRLTLPLTPDHWCRGVFFEGTGDCLILGRGYMEKSVVHYTRESVLLLDEYPAGLDRRFPLEFREGRFYVRLSVNGRENLYYLDTGHSDAVTLPVADSRHAVSPIREIKNKLRTEGGTTSIMELEEERGCVCIGDITRHGPVVYGDYLVKSAYWFNPAIVFAEFALDLSSRVIGFR